MPRYIDLQRGQEALGRFDLPELIRGASGNDYRLSMAVGGGGNGVVFRAHPSGPLALEIDACAVKFLRQQDDTRKDRFQNEIRIMRMLGHERISQIFDAGALRLGDSYDVPWLAMELGGTNLRGHVQGTSYAPAHGPLSQSQLLAIASQLCEAVEHIHQARIIHRDLKPDNFVLDEEDAGSIIMIDFGIAKLIGEDMSARPLDAFTKQMEFVGPAQWASPELVAYSRDKRHPVDERSDLFQLAKTIWFLATGKVSVGVPSRRDCPFDGQLHAIVLQMLSDDPGERLPSASDLRTALNSALR